MRFWTIWTLPAMPLRERLGRTREWAALWVAHRLPRRLAYWSFIDSVGRYTGGDDVIPEIRAMDVLQRMDRT
jgi:hypothetical protein